MTLAELSRGYREAGDILREQIFKLRRKVLQTQDPEEIWRLKQRIRELYPILTQMNELAELTAHYYDKGYCRNEKYII